MWIGIYVIIMDWIGLDLGNWTQVQLWRCVLFVQDATAQHPSGGQDTGRRVSSTRRRSPSPHPGNYACQSELLSLFHSGFLFQATGLYASQHICQARINWEGCVRKGIRRKKMVGWQRWGHQLVWMWWQSIRIVGASACVIFILHQKMQKMAKCTFWYQLTRVVPDKVQRAVKWLSVFLFHCGVA